MTTTPRAPVANTYGGVLIDADGQVLIREPHNHFAGYVWTFAKGGPDLGETPEDAALREVLEETGYRAQIVAPIPGLFRGTTAVTVMFFLMKPLGEQGPLGWETTRTIWVGYDEAVVLLGMSHTAAGRKRDLTVLDCAYRLYRKLGVDHGEPPCQRG